LSDTGFENVHGHSFEKFRIVEKKSAAPLAALAAVFPDVGRQGTKHLVVGAVVDEGAFTSGAEEACAGQSFEVVAQRRGGQIEMRLDVSRRRALRAALNDVAQYLEACRVAECAQLFSVSVERGHVLLLIKSKKNVKA
jgi:hypothetical protein